MSSPSRATKSFPQDLERVRLILTSAGWPDESIDSWLLEPSPLLQGHAPVDLLRADPALVARAAMRRGATPASAGRA